jgi:hypothetical protein
LHCNPIDAWELCFLNQDSTPSANPLRSLDIQLYNDVWFDTMVPVTHPAPFDFSSLTQPTLPFASSPFPSIAELCDSYPDNPPPSIPSPTYIPMVSTTPNSDNLDPLFTYCSAEAHASTPLQLFASILASTNRIFFIQEYLLEGTLHPSWYLVSVNLECSLSNPASANCHTSGTFAVDFYCQRCLCPIVA